MDLVTESPVSRRLVPRADEEILPGLLGQPIDIDLSLASGIVELMPMYPRRSLSAAIEFINSCKELGIQTFMIRMVHGGYQSTVSFEACMGRVAEQQSALQQLRAAHQDVSLVIDPFGLALGQGDQWGVVKHGGPSLHATKRLWQNAVQAYFEAGADWVLTLGRFPDEVLVAKETLRDLGSETKVCCFSTNMETVEAYSYLAGEGEMVDSGQKILPGNVREMLVWALADIACGADMIIIKPCSNTYVMTELMHLCADSAARGAFLEQQTITNMLGVLEGNSFEVFEATQTGLGHDAQLDCLFGTYAISGHYQAKMDLRESRGNSFALDAVKEGHLGILSAAALRQQGVTVFDRTSHWLSGQL